jgi:hypothetical protein
MTVEKGARGSTREFSPSRCRGARTWGGVLLGLPGVGDQGSIEAENHVDSSSVSLWRQRRNCGVKGRLVDVCVVRKRRARKSCSTLALLMSLWE